MTLGAAPDVKLADVKWRVQGRPTNGRAQFVPYVDAVIVAGLLDEWVGADCWSDDYAPAPGKGLWCRLSIRVGDEWVTKTDIGVPSNMEAEKGQVSDAFKRAASLKWGVARNVYRLPNLWAPCNVRQNAKKEDVAYPNDDTLPSIIGQLKSRGFTDAAASEATADHEDETTPPACPKCGEVVPAAPDDREPMRAHLVAEHGYVRQDDGTVVAGNLESAPTNPSSDDTAARIHARAEQVKAEEPGLAERAARLAEKAAQDAPDDMKRKAAADA